MRYCCFLDKGEAREAIVDGDRIVPIDGSMLGDYTRRNDRAIPLAGATLLAPIIPPKILAAAVNYQSHVPSGASVLKDNEAPSVPQMFFKPSSSVIASEDTIVLPAEARRVDAEGELVAVIGRTVRNVSEADALDYVFGYTCGNDVSARHWQRDDVQWWRAKGSDTFSPIGPFIVTDLDPTDLHLVTRVNGEVRQESSTAQQIHSLAAIISFASRVMTLEPGDIIFTGTPGEPPKLDDGDVVEVEIEGIGVLRNPVKRET